MARRWQEKNSLPLDCKIECFFSPLSSSSKKKLISRLTNKQNYHKDTFVRSTVSSTIWCAAKEIISFQQFCWFSSNSSTRERKKEIEVNRCRFPLWKLISGGNVRTSYWIFDFCHDELSLFLVTRFIIICHWTNEWNISLNLLATIYERKMCNWHQSQLHLLSRTQPLRDFLLLLLN